MFFFATLHPEGPVVTALLSAIERKNKEVPASGFQPLPVPLPPYGRRAGKGSPTFQNRFSIWFGNPIGDAMPPITSSEELSLPEEPSNLSIKCFMPPFTLTASR